MNEFVNEMSAGVTLKNTMEVEFTLYFGIYSWLARVIVGEPTKC